MKSKFLLGMFLSLLINSGLNAMFLEANELILSPKDFLNKIFLNNTNLENPGNFVSLITLYLNLTRNKYFKQEPAQLRFVQNIKIILKGFLETTDKRFIETALVIAHNRGLSGVEKYIQTLKFKKMQSV